ncbi:MAG: XRE family transcriptional regulator [Thermodesulfobacteriota bacterium]
MVRKKAEKKSLGQRMKAGREKMGLSIEDLSLETGYLPDMVRGVEEDRTVPPVSLILQLSRVLKLDVDELETEEQTRATKRRSRSHKKRVDSYAYTPLSKPGPDKHLRGYLVTVDAQTDHKGVEYHHEGEEFIFVLRGGVTIQIGDNVTRLAKGESLHFNSSLHHTLSNPNPEEATLLVVVYVP